MPPDFERWDNMTYKKAIEILEQIKKQYTWNTSADEALETAIFAMRSAITEGKEKTNDY